MVLSTDTEFSNDFAVTVDVGLGEVIQQATSLTYEQQQTTTTVMVVLVGLEVFG